MQGMARHLQQAFSVEAIKLHLLRLQPVAGLSTTSQLLKKSKETIVIRRKGEFLFGVSPCLAALRANRRKIHSIYMKPGVAQRQGAAKSVAQKVVRDLATKKKVEIQYVDKAALEKLSGNKPHQGFVVDADPLSFKRMESSDCKISTTMMEENPVWLALDEIHDPMNLGAIIRCAYFLGVDRIITTAKKCCPLTPVVSKASSGAMETMPVYALSGCGLEHFLSEARGNGWTVLGTVGSERLKERERLGERRRESDGQEEEKEEKEEKAKAKKPPVMDCRQYRAKGPAIIVIGNEGYGLHSGVEKVCTALLTIAPRRELPQELDSLNVAVATGIILHSLDYVT